MSELGSSIQFLSGVGPKRAALLQRELGLETLSDLIHFYPFRYIDRSGIQRICDLSPEMAYAQVQARVVSRNLINIKHLSVMVEDDDGRMEIVFFKGTKWAYDKLEPGRVFVFYGKPTEFNGRINMVHPEVDPPQESGASNGTFTGVYPSTEKLRNSGITGKVMCKLQAAALSLCLPEVRETLPERVLRDKGLVSLQYALKNIHFPNDSYALQKAQYRLKFEELFFLQLSLLKQKYIRSREEQGIVMPKVGPDFHACFNSLPYSLTGAQQRVIKEIRADMSGGRQMNRLLQGDVGSGKTMVAVLSCLIAIGNGFQTCIMAPTEVLAKQHFDNIGKYLKSTSVRCALLTGSTGAKERRVIHAGLEDGTIGLIVGTHALLEDNVVFRSLGLAVIDEQHRFGVEQRARLWAKGPVSADGRTHFPPHVLVMTATPIPRTLAMTVYGDLDVSVIDEMPPGRKPVQTLCITPSRTGAMYDFIRKEIAKGRQAFIVYPMIFVNEKLDISNVEQGYEDIVTAFPLKDGYKVALVHGQQAPDVKKFNMDAFAAGRAQILVATTVIEVGVDVPNASVMVIQSAQRFGLSQLHQLRGRVGRGAEKSFCILVRDYKTSAEARQRLDLMCSTDNGFDIAEEDMRMRGPGSLDGTQQSGLPIDLRIASLARDGALLSEARAYAKIILDEDPDLSSEKDSLLAYGVGKVKAVDYSKIS